MSRKRNIVPKKLGKQERAKATVEAIVEAATYILEKKGPSSFTANKVAEKAGVNIASFYQYFPNKEALLFHIVKSTWDHQLGKFEQNMKLRVEDPAHRMRSLVREFFMVESAEADLRQALRIASVDIKDTKEYRALMEAGAVMMRDFIAEAMGPQSAADLDFNTRFISLLIASFAERTTDERTSGAELIRQADMLSEMVIAQFGIGTKANKRRP